MHNIIKLHNNLIQFLYCKVDTVHLLILVIYLTQNILAGCR